jgi:PAS domain-containing protein
MANPDPGKLNDWTTLLVTLGSLIAGLVGVLVGCWGWIKRMVRSVRLSDDWHDRFGSRPVDVIKELHKVSQRCASIAEIQRELLSERLGLGCYVCDPNGECIWSNAVLREMLELDSQQMLGFGWLSTVVEKTAVHEEWLQSIGRRIPYDAEYTVRRSDGNRRARTRAFACVTHDGTMLAYVGYVEWINDKD